MRLDSCFRLPLVAVSLLLAISLSATGADKKKAAKKKTAKKTTKKITYDEHVKPILSAKCRSCHNQDKKSGGLNLTNYTNLMQGGSSGEVVEPGASDDSYLYMLVSHESTPFMPPKSDKLPAKTLKLIKDWIDGGALENSGSKFKKKKGVNLTLKNVSKGRPKGPPPMPPRLSLQPHTYTQATTAIGALATSPWAPLVAVAGQKQVLLYNSKTLQFLGALAFPEGEPKVLKFSRNGALLLAGGGRGGANGKVIVWDVRTAKRVFEVGDEIDSVLAADISADQSMVAMGGPQRIVRIYSTATGKVMHSLRKHTEWIYSLEFSPDGVLLASGDRNGGMFVWEAFTGREYLALRGHGSGITSISWRSDSNIIASSSEDTTVRLWELENGREVKKWGAHGGGVACMEFARDGRILTCGRDRRAKIWNQNGGLIKQFDPFSDLALRVTFCDETNRAIAGDWTGAIGVWNPKDGKKVGSLSVNPPILAVRISNSAKLVVSEKAKSDAAIKTATQQSANYKKAQLAITTAQKKITTAKATIVQAKSNILKYQKDVAARAKVSTTLAAQIAKEKPQLPALQEVAKRTKTLADKNKADKQLQALNTQASAVVAAKKKSIATLQSQLDKNKLETQKQNKAIVAGQKAIKAAQLVVTAETKRLPQLTKNAKAAQAIANKSAATAAAAKKIYDRAVRQAARWRQELKFSAQVKQLSQKLDSADNELNAAEDKLAKAQQDVRNVRSELKGLSDKQVTITKTLQTATGSQKQLSIKKKQADLRVTALSKDAAAKQKTASDITKVVALLKEATAKASAAAKADAKDKKIATSVAALNSLVTARTKQLAQLKQQEVAVTKQLTAQRKQLEATTKLLTSVESQMKQARTAASGLVKELAGLKSKQTTVNKAIDSAKKAVASAKKLVDEATKELTAVRVPPAVAKKST